MSIPPTEKILFVVTCPSIHPEKNEKKKKTVSEYIIVLLRYTSSLLSFFFVSLLQKKLWILSETPPYEKWGKP